MHPNEWLHRNMIYCSGCDDDDDDRHSITVVIESDNNHQHNDMISHDIKTSHDDITHPLFNQITCTDSYHSQC